MPDGAPERGLERSFHDSLDRFWGESTEFGGLIDDIGLVDMHSEQQGDREGSSEAHSQRGAMRNAESSDRRRTKFQCRSPGCEKLYSSYDAVRKHCRKQHKQWLESHGKRGQPQLIAKELVPLDTPADSADDTSKPGVESDSSPPPSAPLASLGEEALLPPLDDANLQASE